MGAFPARNIMSTKLRTSSWCSLSDAGDSDFGMDAPLDEFSSEIHTDEFVNISGLEGNTALTAGIAEMLLQSHSGYIELLPALPAEWPAGHVRGLKARGGFVVEIEWKNGLLSRAVIESLNGSICRIRSERPIRVSSAGGATVMRPTVVHCEFATERGRRYRIAPA